jgi:nuclear pore complex protein Nup210
LPLSLSAKQEIFEVKENNKTFTYLSDKHSIVLAPGASASMELTGGPWPWEDLQTSHKEKLVLGEGVKIIEKKNLKDKRMLEVQCPWSLKGRDIDVKVSVFNEPSEKLWSPGSSFLEFTLACQPPASLQMKWVEDHDELRIAQWRSIPAFYDRFRKRISSKFHDSYWVVLNEQELVVNVSLADFKGREFLNFSTVSLEWITDKADVISYNKLQPVPAHQRVVRIGVNEGPVSLEARIDKMIDGTILNPGIASSLDNQVVKNVDLSIKEYSMYLHRQNSLEISILYGSGLFEVSCNSTDIIQFTYDSDRKIIIFPKKSGKVSIKVDDQGLPGSFPVYCNILVSQLGSLELKEGGLIPVNSSIKLSLSAIDSEGRYFSPSELRWMNFELSMTNAFQTVSVSSSFEDWEIKGTKVGEFQVFAYGSRSILKEEDQFNIRSNQVIIDVFPPLEIIPPEVLLLPGSRYSLNYKGGPDPSKYGFYSIQLVWSTKDNEIATIDSSSGLLNALKVGDTSVILQMIRKQSVLTQAFGKVRVRLATSVGILGMGPGRSVLVDSATRLIAQIFYNGEEISDCTINAQFTWKSNSPAVYSIFQENDDISKQVAVTGLALSPGKSDITLHIDIQYPEEYRDREHTFTSKVTAAVEPGLISQSPSHRCHSYITFNCESEFPRWLDSLIFLLPTHSAFKLPVSKEEKTHFRCIDCREDFLKITDNGVLFSSGQKGEASVIIQNNRVKGDTFMASVIVADIESIHVDKSYVSRTIALGSELEFDVIYQDSIARSFPRGFEYGIDVSVEVSNSRVLQASLENRNTTLKIYSQYAGDTIVKVFLNKNPKVKDVLKISVNSVMKPVSPVLLHLGGEVQFETTHSTPAGVVGVWTVENTNILSVTDKGLAKSLQEGDTFVHYREKSMDLRSLVSVQKVKSLELGLNSPTVISNYERHPNFRESYKVPIRLFADSDKMKEIHKLSSEQKKNIKQNLHVRCYTNSHSDFVFVESEIDKADKERWGDEPGYGCLVTPNTNPSTTALAPKDLIINIIVGSKGRSLYTFESSVKIPFVSKFSIPNQDKQIVLYGKSTTHSVLLAGNCGSLQVNSESPYIHAKKQETSDRCTIDLTVLNTESEIKLKRVEILDSITGQKEELLVTYYNDASRAEIGSPMSLNDLVIFIALCLLLFVVYNFFKNNQQQPVQPAYRNFNYQPPRFPAQPTSARMQTPGPPGPGPAGPASTPGSSAFKNIGYRPNF